MRFHRIPNESTLRKTYATSSYEESVVKVRDEIKDGPNRFSIDETTEKEVRLVRNLVMGFLNGRYSKRIL